jgi:hypothetical protein
MDNDTNSKIPLLEDIETALDPSEESIYPVKLQKKKDCHWKKCKRGKCKKGRCIKKCFGIICRVALALFLLFTTIAAIAGYRWHRWVSEHVEQWTVTEPNALPIEDVPSSELSAMKDAAKLFWDSVQDGKVPEDFVLSARDINGLIAASDFLRGDAFAEMETNEYQVSVSLPTDGLPGGKGRFFVATKTVTWDPNSNEIKVTIEPKEESMGTMAEAVLKLTTMEDDKTLNLEVLSGQAFGKLIPQDFIDERYNLLEDLYHCHCHDNDCKLARKFLEGLAGVSLEDGQVVFHPEVEASEATYYMEHKGHSWHHDGRHHHHRHHGKHGGHHDKQHGKHGDRPHGRGHRSLRAKIGAHRNLRALRMIRRLMA